MKGIQRSQSDLEKGHKEAQLSGKAGDGAMVSNDSGEKFVGASVRTKGSGRTWASFALG